MDELFYRAFTKPPERRLSLYCGGLSFHLGSAFLISLAVFAAGCSSTSRFRSHDDTSGSTIHDEDEFRFASKIREEESREDDKKVDVSTASKKLTSQASKGKYSNMTPEGISRDLFLLDVVSYLGVPYRYGGNGKDGIDCS